MEVFEGTVRLANDTVALRAVLLVADDRLKVSTEEHEIGDWKLTELTASLMPDGCQLTVEGEELVVSVPEPIRFAEAIGPRMTNPGDGSLLTSSHPDHRAEPAEGIRRRVSALLGRVPPSAQWGALLVVGVMTLAAWAPAILVAIVLLSSLVVLLVGSWALLDPFTAVRLPDPATPMLLLGSGAGGVAVALALAVIL